MTAHTVWRIVGASVAGTSHRARAAGRQDAFASRALPDGTLILAVADGAGSAPRSAEGATRAAEHVVHSLRRMILKRCPQTDADWERVIWRACLNARLSVLALARFARRPPRDFATTLTCAVLTDERLIVGQVGDGLAVVRDVGGVLHAPVRPSRGEYANETAFLTMPGMTHALQVVVTPVRGQAVAVTTDGLLRLAAKIPGYEPFPPFFTPLFAFVEGATDTARAAHALAQFLDSERVNGRTDDDKTLVLATRLAPAETAGAEMVAESV